MSEGFKDGLSPSGARRLKNGLARILDGSDIGYSTLGRFALFLGRDKSGARRQ
jgi:hypothetical protein